MTGTDKNINQVSSDTQSSEGNEQQLSQEMEDRARGMGWIPKEEFKGDESRWTPANEYVERAETLMPVMRSQMRRYEDDLKTRNQELATTSAELKTLRETMSKVIETNQKVSEREFDRALATLKKEQVTAVSEANPERWQELEAEKDRLIENKPQAIEIPQANTPPQGGDVTESWKKDNPWFGTDPEMASYAASIENFVANANPTLSSRDILDKVTEEVKLRYPDKFKNPNRRNPPTVDGGGSLRGGGDLKGAQKTFADLPDEARKACAALISSVPGYTKEKYVLDYFG